jgi:tetratricopeptide (TPR) repeat protein
MRSKTLKTASKLFKTGSYNKVLQVLEPQVFRYRQSFDFFYYLGISCLNTSDFGGGYSYLQRALDLKPDDIKTMAGLALVHFKRQENSEAIQQWFNILDIDPNNKLAKKGLDILKKNLKQEDYIEFINSGKFLTLLPGRKSFIPRLKIISLIILIVLALIISSFYIYTGIFDTKIKRPEISAVELNHFGSLTNEDVEGKYNFSDKEIRKIFDSIRKHFDSFHDNLAMKEINRLLLSNADTVTKQKVELLATYITVPGFSTLKTNYSYQEFVQEPELYNNCYVHWKGRLSNLIVSEKVIKFDFLVGYDDRKVLEGIIPVILNFGARINSEFPIEILGKIVMNEGEYGIEAVSIHQYQ